MVCRTTVTAENDILHTGQTSQCLYIRIMRLQRHRISEEEKVINLTVHNAGTHLLVTTQRTGFQNGKVPLNIGMLFLKSLKDKSSCSTCTIELVPHKQFGVPENRRYSRRARSTANALGN